MNLASTVTVAVNVHVEIKVHDHVDALVHVNVRTHVHVNAHVQNQVRVIVHVHVSFNVYVNMNVVVFAHATMHVCDRECDNACFGCACAKERVRECARNSKAKCVFLKLDEDSFRVQETWQSLSRLQAYPGMTWSLDRSHQNISGTGQTSKEKASTGQGSQ